MYRYKVLGHWVGIEPITQDSQSQTQTTWPVVFSDNFFSNSCDLWTSDPPKPEMQEKKSLKKHALRD